MYMIVAECVRYHCFICMLTAVKFDLTRCHIVLYAFEMLRIQMSDYSCYIAASGLTVKLSSWSSLGHGSTPQTLNGPKT